MNLRFKARDWHAWASVILLVPMLLVGMSAIFIAHKKSLELDEIDLTPFVAWLPGYGPGKRDKPEVRAGLVASDGRRWIAGREGLYRIVDGKAEEAPELAGIQVRGLVAAPWGLVAATKRGVWLERDGAWTRTLGGDAGSASLNADGSVTVSVDKGLASTRNGREWTIESIPGIGASPRGAGERITLGRLAMDLHTGKAFLGKEAEWVWIDLLGFAWVFLGFTGLHLWWRTQTRRRDAARRHPEAARG